MDFVFLRPLGLGRGGAAVAFATNLQIPTSPFFLSETSRHLYAIAVPAGGFLVYQ